MSKNAPEEMTVEQARALIAAVEYAEKTFKDYVPHSRYMFWNTYRVEAENAFSPLRDVIAREIRRQEREYAATKRAERKEWALKVLAEEEKG